MSVPRSHVTVLRLCFKASSKHICRYGNKLSQRSIHPSSHLRDQRNQWLHESLRNSSYHVIGYISQTANGGHGDFFTVRSGVREEKERSKTSAPVLHLPKYPTLVYQVCVCVCAHVHQVCVE